MCCTHSVLLLYADRATLCVPYSTLPYSLLLGCGPALLYVRLTLHDPILGCGHTLSLRRCGDCLICVFLILYLYNVVSGDCDPHFVFTPRILRVTWVSKSLLTLPLLFIITTRHYHYSTLHYLPTLPLLSLQKTKSPAAAVTSRHCVSDPCYSIIITTPSYPFPHRSDHVVWGLEGDLYLHL